MKKLRLGVAGLGTVFLKKHLPAIVDLKDRFTISYIYSSSPQKFGKIKAQVKEVRYCRSLEMLCQQDVDAIIACVPLPLHAKVAVAVIHSGKHVLLEKPMAHSRKEAERIVELARNKNKKIFVAENFRCLSSVRKLKDILGQGSLGKIKFVQVDGLTKLDETSLYYQRPWRRNPKGYPGIIWEGGIHFVSIIRFLFGSLTVRFKRIASLNPSLGKDTMVAHLKTGKNVDVLLNVSYSMIKDEGLRIKVYGEKGVARVEMSKLTVERGRKKNVEMFAFQEYQMMYKEFYEYILMNKKPSYSSFEALGDIRFLNQLTG